MTRFRATVASAPIRKLLFLLAVFASDTTFAMNSEERLLFANGLYRRGMYEMAIPEYKALLSSDTAMQMHDLAAFRLGECYRSLGMTNDAVIFYDLVMDEHLQSVFVHRAAFRRAELDWQAGRLRDAAGRFQKLIEQKPPADIEAASLYHLGLCYSGMDRFKDADRNFRRMLSRHPTSPYADYARVALADILEQSGGSTDEMAKLLNQVVSTPETPALGAEAAAKAALLAYRLRDMKEASRLFTLLAGMPENPWIVRTRLEAAWSHILSDKFEKARVLAVNGLESAPPEDRPVWLYLRANIERRARDASSALKFYDEFLATAPGHEWAPVAAFEACGLAYQQQEYARVLELSELAASYPDSELQLLWMKAGALRGLGKNEAAAKVFRDLVKKFPDSEQAPTAAYQLALLAEEDGRIEEAAEAYMLVAEKYPASPMAADAFMAAASAALRAGKTEMAVQAWQNVTTQFPDYARIDEAWMGRARAEVELGRDHEAAKSLDQLLKHKTAVRLLAEAHFLRATLFEKAEKFEMADRHYQIALEQKPSISLARQIQHRRVTVLQRQGRNDEAAALMNQLISAGTAGTLPSPLLEWLARWNLEKQAYEDAERAGRRLAETGETPAWRQVGWYTAGVAAWARKDAKSARPAFRAAAELGLRTRETADSHFHLGLIALEEKKPGPAVAGLSRAAEHASDDAWMDIRAKAYLKLGVAHEALGEWADAARYYLGVGLLFDDAELTPESLYRAAGALHAQQQAKERDRVIKELKERYPDSEWTARARERWSENTQE
ncbi:MAG TPA: tetratricopeptide repeat protein [Kiritimatiellia bacterium]|nr:tetratricopeptide repeat protein [Kiritimatiellia bacterium]